MHRLGLNFLIVGARFAISPLRGGIVPILVGLLFGPAYALNGGPDQAGDAKPLNYDYVILALSWSPTYCAAKASRAEEPQCQNQANRGFVVHGLWPQANDGARLRCPAGKSDFSKALFERALQVYPDLKLAQSQWQRHGQCFGLAADAYLERTAQARAKLQLPERFRALDKPLSLPPDELSAAFRNANAGLTMQSISVSCRASRVVGVLVCLKSDLSEFAPCPQVAKRTCRATTIELPSVSRP